MVTVTTLEDLCVELFYEIFTYFQLHEIWHTFGNLNSRINGIIENLPSISVYLGRCGMNIEVTNFYYEYLSQTNLCARLISLCVSDAYSIDNSLWFAEHGSTFINLRHLSLIDIKRSSFEMILDSLSPIDSLIMFNVHVVSADHHAAFTYGGVTEHAYHERIFRLFPSLRVCRLLFGQCSLYTMHGPFFTPLHQSSVPIQSNLLNLQSLTLRYCLPEFISYLFERLPQLQQFSCHLYNYSWIPHQHSIKHDYNKYVSLFRIIHFKDKRILEIRDNYRDNHSMKCS